MADVSDRPIDELVKEIVFAVRDSRVDDLLVLVDRGVEWHPVTRPGRSLYVGHDGTRQMVDDLHRARGDFEIDFKEMTVGADTATARICLRYTAGDGTEVEQWQTSTATFANGKLTRFESEPE